MAGAQARIACALTPRRIAIGMRIAPNSPECGSIRAAWQTLRPRNPVAPAPRLYLITPPVEHAAIFARELAAALETADVAAVLLRLAEADERSQIDRVRAVGAAVQDKNIALLLDRSCRAGGGGRRRRRAPDRDRGVFLGG